MYSEFQYTDHKYREGKDVQSEGHREGTFFVNLKSTFHARYLVR